MIDETHLGKKVRLNDRGLVQCFGTTIGQAHMKSLEMTVTHVDMFSITVPERTVGVEVDNQDINQFMIDNHCFDPA